MTSGRDCVQEFLLVATDPSCPDYFPRVYTVPLLFSIGGSVLYFRYMFC